MKKYILNYINDNKKILSILFLCIIIGLVIGIITYQFVGFESKTELCKTIKSTLDITKSQGFEGINVIKNGLASNIILVLIIYAISITLVAPIGMCILNIFKGFTIGLYIPVLFQIFGFGNGILALILLVILPNIIYIPAFTFISTNGVNLFYNLTDRSGNSNKITTITKEVYLLILGFSLIFLSILIEQFTSLSVISIYSKL